MWVGIYLFWKNSVVQVSGYVPRIGSGALTQVHSDCGRCRDSCDGRSERIAYMGLIGGHVVQEEGHVGELWW